MQAGPIVAPPSYAYSALPAYTPDARPGERSISGITTGANAARSVTEEYQYKNGRLTLNLGPKRFGMFRPTYGWNETINGYVQVKKNTKSVQSIVATVEGHVTTGVSERGFLTEKTRTTVLRLSQTLFDASSGERVPRSGARYVFTFPIQSHVTGGLQPLPPSFGALHPGIGADVTYYVRVEMARKGKLRQDERVKAFFNYLPRTYAPPRAGQMSNSGQLKPVFDGQLNELQNFEVLPKFPRGVSSVASHLSVSLALPRPLVYASNSTIPFFLTVVSGVQTEAISKLFSNLSMQLIRVTTLQTGAARSACEAVVGGGDVFHFEEWGNTRILCGHVTCSQGGEASWRAGGIEVKYLIRVKLSPRTDIHSLACALPTYLREVVLSMETHQQTWDENEEALRMPALCRLPGPVGL